MDYSRDLEDMKSILSSLINHRIDEITPISYGKQFRLVFWFEKTRTIDKYSGISLLADWQIIHKGILQYEHILGKSKRKGAKQDLEALEKKRFAIYDLNPSDLSLTVDFEDNYQLRITPRENREEYAVHASYIVMKRGGSFRRYAVKNGKIEAFIPIL
jgi:hypothetical protein